MCRGAFTGATFKRLATSPGTHFHCSRRFCTSDFPCGLASSLCIVELVPARTYGKWPGQKHAETCHCGYVIVITLSCYRTPGIAALCNNETTSTSRLNGVACGSLLCTTTALRRGSNVLMFHSHLHSRQGRLTGASFLFPFANTSDQRDRASCVVPGHGGRDLTCDAMCDVAF